MKSKANKKSIIKILIIIFISLLFIYNYHSIFKNSKIEGFFETIDKYDYIAPVTETISDVEWTMLYNKIIKDNPTTDLTIETLKPKFTNFITKKEINYYLKNGTFQWSDYVLNKFRTIFPTEINGEKINVEENIKNSMKAMPNRYVYNEFLMTPGIQEDLQSDFYLTYTGEKPVPTKLS